MAWLSWIFDRGVLLNLVFAAAAYALFLLGNLGYDVSLRDVQYFNGWLLLGCMAVMMLLTLRKRVVILPFGRVRFWLLLHIYLGFVTVGIFLAHTHYQLPNTPLEWLLWGLFVLVAISGLMGTWMSKTIPTRLESYGERMIFERIPVFRAQLAAEAEALALKSVEDGNTRSIAKLYNDLLGRFFARPRNVLAHLRASRLPLTRLQGELDSIERYLDDDGKARLARMRELVEAKNSLDFHYANAGLLKLWLFLHIPPTYALAVVIVIHVVIAYAFSTGIA